MASCSPQNLGKLLLCGLLASACGENPTSTLQHDVRQPTRVTTDWNWVTVSRDDFMSHSLNMGPVPGRFPIADQFKALEERATFWVNLLDKKLRAQYPQKMKQVPVPQVQVITDDSPNAFITAGFSCYEVPLQLADSGTTVGKVLWRPIDGGGEFLHWPDEFACLPAEPSSLFAAIQVFNAAEGSCKLHVTNGAIALEGKCDTGSSLQGVGNAKSIVLPRTANWVTIHAGLFPFMPTEDAFVGVLMHELTHYYRSHMTQLPGEYNFFYQRGEENENHRPEPRPDLLAEGQKAIIASHILGQERMPLLPGQELAPELYLAAGSLAEAQCAGNPNCASSCQEIVKLATTREFIVKMGLYPFSPADQSTYTRFEATMMRCLRTIPAAGAYDSLKEFILAPTWIPFRKKLSPDTLAMLGAILGRVIPRLPATLPRPSYPSAKEITMDISAILNLQIKMAMDILTEAHEKKIGFYTDEQEADEASIEWLSLLGLKPSAGVDTYLTLAGNSTEASFGGFIWGGKTCQDLYRNHWRDQNGNAVIVPIGNFTDTHHSSCFRAYNADLEIQAHQYPLTPSESVVAIGLSWEEIQRIATRATSPLRKGTEEKMPPAVSAAKKRVIALNKHWHECPWAPK